MSTTHIPFPTFYDSDTIEERQAKLVIAVGSHEGHSYSLTAYINEVRKRIDTYNEQVFEMRAQLIRLRNDIHKLQAKQRAQSQKDSSKA